VNLKEWEWLFQSLALNRVPLAIVLVVGARLLAGLLNRAFDELGESFTERRFLFKRIALFSGYVIYLAVTGAVIALVVVGDEARFAVSAMVVLALGFSFKDVLASIAGGLLLLGEAPFRVGDRISFGGYYGEVTKIGLRSVQLVTLDDNLVTLPNSRFLTEPVASANAGAPDAMVVIPFYLAPDADFDEARRLILEATVTSRFVYLEKPVVTLVSEEVLAHRFVTVVRVKAYVFDVRYEKAFASDVTERAKRALRRAGIRTPEEPSYRAAATGGDGVSP